MTDPTPPQPARTIPVRTAPPVPPARSGKPAPVTGPWRPSMLMVAPHRLAFWLAMLILVVASGWWLLVQEDRVHGWFGLGYAVSPTLTHAAAMVFGFMPLFFAGFLFTAGPNWLRVEPLPVPRLQWPLFLQAGGWLLWLAGAHLQAGVALTGLAMLAGHDALALVLVRTAL